MNENLMYLVMGVLGVFAGLKMKRSVLSGKIALALPLASCTFLWLALGRS